MKPIKSVSKMLIVDTDNATASPPNTNSCAGDRFMKIAQKLLVRPSGYDFGEEYMYVCICTFTSPGASVNGTLSTPRSSPDGRSRSLVLGVCAVGVVAPPAVDEERGAFAAGEREVVAVTPPPPGQAPAVAVGPRPGRAPVRSRGADPRVLGVTVSPVVDPLRPEHEVCRDAPSGVNVVSALHWFDVSIQ